MYQKQKWEQPVLIYSLNCACVFIRKSAEIKYHQLLSKIISIINRKLCFDQLATASFSTSPSFLSKEGEMHIPFLKMLNKSENSAEHVSTWRLIRSKLVLYCFHAVTHNKTHFNQNNWTRTGYTLNHASQFNKEILCKI